MLYIFIKIFSDFFNLRIFFFYFLFLSLPPPILTEPEDPEHKIKIICPKRRFVWAQILESEPPSAPSELDKQRQYYKMDCFVNFSILVYSKKAWCLELMALQGFIGTLMMIAFKN